MIMFTIGFTSNRPVIFFVIHLIYLVIASTAAAHGRLRARKVGGFAQALRLDVEVGDQDEANETIAAAADVDDDIEGSEFASVACRLREC
jgi:hypothetical protein